MIKRLLVETRPFETRVALMEDNRLAEISIERNGNDALTGNIYIGRVDNLLNGMQAAFIDIGLEKNAFLPLSDQSTVKSGQEILVQIEKIPGGEKGAKVTDNIMLPGRMCVLMPFEKYSIGISKRIENEAERERIKKAAIAVCPKGMGLIMRTAAEGAEEDEIRKDVLSLVRIWEDIRTRSKVVQAPRLLYRESNAIMRAIRDNLTDDITEMLFDDKAAYEIGVTSVNSIIPELRDRLKLVCSDISLFRTYSVKQQLEKALARRVWLKSGGYLVFDKTEALTVIDVNSGKFTGKNDLQETIFTTNMEAAEEIANQLRLRDIGGIIIIDFIDMETKDKRDLLLSNFRNALSKDRTHISVSGITALGLVEMTRKRRRMPLDTYMKTTCSVCAGAGFLTSPLSVALDTVSDMKERTENDKEGIYLLKANFRVIDEIDRLHADLSSNAYMAADERIPSHEYSIEKIGQKELPSKAKQINGSKS